MGLLRDRINLEFEEHNYVKIFAFEAPWAAN